MNQVDSWLLSNWRKYLLRVGRLVVEAIVIEVPRPADGNGLRSQVHIGRNVTAKLPVASCNKNIVVWNKHKNEAANVLATCLSNQMTSY